MLNADKVEALRKRAQREIDEGLLPSCQFALAMDDEVVVLETYGDATNDTRYAVFSCTKAITASAVWQLIADGALDVSRRVVDYIPEFGTNGKDVITVEQVMLHTSGFPHAPLGPPEWYDRAERIKRFSEWKLNWEPGTRYEYHPTSAHWVLGELIERLSGIDYRRFIRERVLDPLGLARLQVGVPLEEQGDIAMMAERGEPATPDELEAVLGVRELPVTEVTDAALMSFNEPANRELGVPGGGGVSGAADLALFYQALLHNPDKLWDQAVLVDGTSNVRNMLPDRLNRQPAFRTLGLHLAGDDGYGFVRGFGRTVSPRSFGHGGAAGQIAWADPDTGLSFAYVTNGIDANVLRLYRRGTALSSIAGDCAH